MITVIRYENAPVLEATWTDDAGIVTRCHAYDATQMGELRADLGAEAAQYEALIQQCIADYTPPAQAPQTVPQQITRAQGKAALISAGLWAGVLEYVTALPDETQRALADVALNDTLTWQRSSLFLNSAAEQLGLSQQDLDELFIAAAKIEF